MAKIKVDNNSKTSKAKKSVIKVRQAVPYSTIKALSHDDLILLSGSYIKTYSGSREAQFRKMPESHVKYLTKKGNKVYASLEKNKDSRDIFTTTVRSIDEALSESEKRITKQVLKQAKK